MPNVQQEQIAIHPNVGLPLQMSSYWAKGQKSSWKHKPSDCNEWFLLYSSLILSQKSDFQVVRLHLIYSEKCYCFCKIHFMSPSKLFLWMCTDCLEAFVKIFLWFCDISSGDSFSAHSFQKKLCFISVQPRASKKEIWEIFARKPCSSHWGWFYFLFPSFAFSFASFSSYCH